MKVKSTLKIHGGGANMLAKKRCGQPDPTSIKIQEKKKSKAIMSENQPLRKYDPTHTHLFVDK